MEKCLHHEYLVLCLSISRPYAIFFLISKYNIALLNLLSYFDEYTFTNGHSRLQGATACAQENVNILRTSLCIHILMIYRYISTMFPTPLTTQALTPAVSTTQTEEQTLASTPSVTSQTKTSGWAAQEATPSSATRLMEKTRSTAVEAQPIATEVEA